ncbi:MAG: multidrug transporter [Clostridia bacterium]|nr:multidrug transporter [Clostridia bacterium]
MGLLRAFWYRVWKNESGMGTVEIIIIIAVLVTLALVFRGFIMDLAEGIFDKIQEKTNSAISDL